jgi:hypothetical protein
VMLFAPLSAPLSPADAGAVGVQHVVAGAVVITLLAVVGPALGPWIAVAAAIGSLVALAIHVWYDRHPLNIPIPAESARRVPQINFSSMDVAGNIGGLIFVVGSVFIVVVGLPSVIWFLFAATVAGGLIAWALVAWHTSHPGRGLPGNRIVLR